jgi:hypothetical protein
LRLELRLADGTVPELVARVALDADSGAVRGSLGRADRLDVSAEAVTDVLEPCGAFVVDLGEPAASRTGDHAGPRTPVRLREADRSPEGRSLDAGAKTVSGLTSIK